MADNVEVKLGGDYGEATDGAKDAASSIADSLQKISAQLENFGSKNKDISQKAIQNNADLSRSFLELKGSATGGFNAIAGVIERFKGVLGGLATVIGGGFLWSEAIGHMESFNSEVTQLENVLGMASDKATQFAIALKISGSSAEAYTGLALKMARQLKSNEEEFARNGIVTRDSAGALLPLDQAMQNAFDRMQQLKSGTDQAEFALQFFGRSVQEVYQMIVVLPAAQARAAELMKDMNVEWGPDKQAAVRNYQIEVGAFKEMLGIAADDIGIKVLPSLERLAKYFNETGPAVVSVFMKSLTGLLITVDTVANGFAEWHEKLKTGNEAGLVSDKTYWAAAKALMTQGWDAAKAIWDAGMKERERIMLEGSAKILGMEADLQKRLAILAGDGSVGKPGPGPLGHGPGHFVPTPKKDTGEESAGWENILKASQDAYNRMELDQGSFKTWSEEMTRDYWQQVIGLTAAGTKARMEAENKYYDAERKVQQQAFAAQIAGLDAQIAGYKHNIEAKIAIAQQEYDMEAQRYGAESAQAQAAYKKILEYRQQLADQVKRIADIQAAAEAEHYKAQIALFQQNADQQVALGQITNQQRLAQEATFQNQLYDQEHAGLLKRRADAEGDVVAQAEIDKQILTLEDQHQAAMTKIANQGVLDREKYALEADKQIESSFSTLLSDLVEHTKTVKQSFMDFFKSVSDGLTKIASNKVAEQMFGPGSQGGSFISGISSKIFGGGGTSVAETANTTALSANTTALLANTAAVGGSGVSGAAGGVAGGSFGGIFGDLIPSFDVGSPYIPQDTLAVVHKGEKIIPAKYNNGGASFGVRNQFMINGPIDTRTMQQISHASEKAQRKASIRLNK